MPFLPKYPGWLHSGLGKRACLLFLHVDSVVVHATGVTAAGRMLAVATDATVTHRHVTPHTSCLFQPCNLHTRVRPRALSA